MCRAVNASANGRCSPMATFNDTFTFAKEVLTAAIAFLIYKKLSPMLHGRK